VNTPPRVERQVVSGRVEFRAQPAGAAFYTSADGTRWRIYDCVFREGTLERVYLEADLATHRVFADGETGRRLVHRRRKYEVFKLSPETCERQLASARVFGQDPIEASDDAVE
jgi:hypothetical protein